MKTMWGGDTASDQMLGHRSPNLGPRCGEKQAPIGPLSNHHLQYHVVQVLLPPVARAAS